MLFRVPSFDFIFIHREAAPIGPPIIEWVIGRVLKKKIIYDFDDAIWTTDNSEEGHLAKILKCRWKVKWICKWSHQISCGNDYLVSFAKEFNQKVTLNPTTVDTENLHRPRLTNMPDSPSRLVLGWTGSSSTLKYWENLQPVFQCLQASYPSLEFWVIADRKPNTRIENFHFKRWSLEMEIDDLLQFTIGLMPLPDDPWTKGKCGFKIIQYMALCIPSVASPVGINSQVIQHGENGFLCQDQNDWLFFLKSLIDDPALREKIAHKGRASILKRYSIESNKNNFISLFY